MDSPERIIPVAMPAFVILRIEERRQCGTEDLRPHIALKELRHDLSPGQEIGQRERTFAFSTRTERA